VPAIEVKIENRRLKRKRIAVYATVPPPTGRYDV
jgi:hypothetical protein